MEYPSPYTANDFASFLTFTMFNFYNQPHRDSDVNDWTLVIWIPIFNPQTRTEDDPVLADEGFDKMGGQFTFCDFQVYLDLKAVLGVTTPLGIKLSLAPLKVEGILVLVFLAKCLNLCLILFTLTSLDSTRKMSLLLKCLQQDNKNK
jgi:hypothetical protein